ncbi:hypothetical protein [Lacinutrix salivirga]
MNNLIKSVINTLKKTNLVLYNISEEDYVNNSVPPYYSSIGSHIRHIFDFYNCIIDSEDNVIDLTLRRRNLEVELSVSKAIEQLNTLIRALESLNSKLNETILVIDDLGLGKITIEYNYSSLLAQSNSHTIHHYAIINYILDHLKIEIEDSEFGLNPTTPKILN